MAFSIDVTRPSDDEFIRFFPGIERTFRTTVRDWLQTEHDATTGRNQFDVDTTTNLAAETYPVGGFRYDTTVGALQFQTASGIWETIGFPSGTRAIFFQETAPTGWTKITDVEVDGAIVELSTGTDGGDYAGTTTIITQTLSQANLPNVNFALSGNTGIQSADHTHAHSATTSTAGDHGHAFRLVGNGTETSDASGGIMVSLDAVRQDFPAYSGALSDTAGQQIGAGGSHSHTVSGTTGGMSASHTHSLSGATAASGGSGTAPLANVKRVLAILCQKD